MNGLLCDSSSLISLTSACSIDVIKFLHNKFGLAFYISDNVEYESITHPLNIQPKTYVLSALRIKSMLLEGTIKKISLDERTEKLMDEILQLANHLFYIKGKPITLMHKGEAEIVALSKVLDLPYLLMDERTTRLLIESPMKIKEHLEKEFRTNVMINKRYLKSLTDIMKNIKVIRSTELVYYAYKYGYYSAQSPLSYKLFEATLYSLKFGGCAVSFKEIEEISEMGRNEKATYSY